MIELGELMDHLTDQEWIKQRVSSSLDQSLFEEIHNRIFHATDDSGANSHWDDKRDLFEEQGVNLGKLHPKQDIYNHFPYWSVQEKESIEPGVDVYVLKSGRLLFVQKKEGDYDTGKSISAYGEYGTYEERRVLVPTADLMSPYVKDIIDMIVKKLEKTE